MKYILSILAFFSLSVQAAIINNIEPSRIEGVAPLAVFFDATDTTSTGTSRPFHELHYAWDFGDPGAGQWQYGNENNRDRNKAFGPVASHVFETPGTYTVTLRTKGKNGDTDTDTVRITVTDPDATFVGVSTVCFSASGNFNGCPAGSVRETTNDAGLMNNYLDGGKRFLFRGGETFNIDARVRLNENTGSISSFGGGRATIHHTGGDFTLFRVGYRVEDWRITDLVFTGGGGDGTAIVELYGETKDILFANNENIDGYGRAVLANNALFRLYDQDIGQGLFVVNNNLQLYSSHAMFIAAGKLAIMGNYLDDTTTRGGEHVVRITHLEQGVINHNFLAHPLINKGVLTIRNAQRELNCKYCGRDTREFVVSDNMFYGGADNTVALVGAQGSGYTGHGHDGIVERNYFAQGEDTPGESQMALNVVNIDGVTIRNNIVLMSNWQTYRSIDLGTTQPAENVFVYNNSCYTPDNPRIATRCVNNRAASNVIASNNLMFAPNKPNAMVIDGHFTGEANVLASTNPYDSNGIQGPGDFLLAEDLVGGSVPVFVDYTGAERKGNTVGAYGFGGTVAPPPAPPLPSLLDTDGDGVVDENDNCVDTPNPNQIDTDQDGIGDACEASSPTGPDPVSCPDTPNCPDCPAAPDPVVCPVLPAVVECAHIEVTRDPVSIRCTVLY